MEGWPPLLRLFCDTPIFQGDESEDDPDVPVMKDLVTQRIDDDETERRPECQTPEKFVPAPVRQTRAPHHEAQAPEQRQEAEESDDAALGQKREVIAVQGDVPAFAPHAAGNVSPLHESTRSDAHPERAPEKGTQTRLPDLLPRVGALRPAI